MRRSWKSRVGILLLGLAVFTAPATLDAYQAPELATVVPADDYAAQIEEARALVIEMMHETGTPGVSVAVGMDGKVLWSEGFGWADIELRVPVTSLTKFRVGSVSKPMAAAAMGILRDQGRLDMSATVQTYVPEFGDKQWPVTVRQVSSHVGGVRHYRGRENFSAERYPDVLSGLDIFKDDDLLFRPGTDYSYSSYGWNLLSVVVERAAETEFLTYMRDEVFEPLNMIHTVADHTDSLVVDRTSFYVRGENNRVINAPYVDNSYKWAGGGFLSTPEDMLKFGFAHMEPGLLSQDTLEEWFTPYILNNGENTGYGVGWRSSTNDAGEHVVSHTGGSIGGTTVLLVNRTTGLVVAAVGNMSSVPIPALGNQIAAVFGGN